jgi:hypothetical protein
MSVVLISRGSMSGGQIIAKCLEHIAGLRCVTREDLVALVNQRGELANKVMASIDGAARNYEKFSELRRPYKILMRLALLDYARKGNLAYLGYSGHLLVEGISHFVKVRLIAPIQLRTKTTMEQLRCGEEEALEFIRRADEERIRWGRFMYGKNIQDPRLYDLCINMDKLSFAGVCSLLMRVIEEKEYQPTDESLAALENLYVAAKVEAALVTHPKTFAYEIAARANDGRVSLEGPYLENPERSLVAEIVGAVPGVASVEYLPGYAPSLEFLP